MSAKPKQPEEACAPLWMVSFGDCISLLVTFFVMLISFSDLEEAKLLELMGAMKGGFRMTQASNITLGTSINSRKVEKNIGASEGQTMVAKHQASKVAAHEVVPQKRFSSNIVGSFDKGYVLRLLDEGLSFIIKTESLFEPGTAKLIEKKDDVLGVVADVAADLENEVRIVGVVPETAKVISSSIRTPWGLGTERAMVLKEGLINKAEFNPARFSLGTRVEGREGDLIHRREVFPPERMEIIIVGFRDLSKVKPEEAIIKDRWK